MPRGQPDDDLQRSLDELLNSLPDEPVERTRRWVALRARADFADASKEQRTWIIYGLAVSVTADPTCTELDRLRHAAALLDEALEIAPRDRDVHGRIAIASAEITGRVYGLTADPTVLEQWLLKSQEWSESIPSDDWRAPLYSLAEGTLLCQVAMATGTSEHIDVAIKVLQAARDSVAPRSGICATSSALLANIFLYRYERTADPADLELTLQSAWRAANHDRANPKERFTGVVTLAISRIERYKRTQEQDDLIAGATFADHSVEMATTAEERYRAHGVRGVAFRHLHDFTDEPEHLDAAIESFCRVLEYASLIGGEVQAAAVDNYGNCLMDRYLADGDVGALEEAVTMSRQALALSPTDSPTRSVALGNLAASLVAAYDRTGSRADLDEATTALRSALSGENLPPGEEFVLCARLASTLTRAAATTGYLDGLKDALTTFQRAESLLDQTGRVPLRYSMGTEQRYGNLPEHHVGALVQCAQVAVDKVQAEYLAQMLEVGERAKSRVLSESEGYTSLTPPDEVPDDLAQSERNLLSDLDHLAAVELAGFGRAADDEAFKLVSRRHSVRAKLEEIWQQMAEVGPAAAEYVRIRRGKPIPLLSTLDRSPTNTGFIALLAAAGIAPGRRSPSSQLVAVAYRPGWPQPLVVSTEPGVNPVPDAARRFTAEVPGDAGLGLRAETWHKPLLALLRPLVEKLGDVHKIVLSPPPSGQSLPWHLLLRRCGVSATCPVVTTPSLAQWAVRQRRRGYDHRYIRGADPQAMARRALGWISQLANDIAPSPLVIGDPTGDLPAAVEEARQVAEILNVEPLLGAAATVEQVRDRLELASVAHIAAHARFDSSSPLDSEIRLANGELSPRTLLEMSDSAELVVLSACESATGGTLAGADVMGLAHALLRAGTRTVVASLWSVDDSATAFLMSEFYRGRAAGLSEATALAAAAAQTSARPNWSSPYFWAGFVLIQLGASDE